MTEDIKTTLYALLGKKKVGVPQYNVQEDKRNGRAMFKCELRVPFYPYIGLGSSGSKKDAMSNAARDFAYWLLREEIAKPNDFPQLNVSLL